MRDRAELSRFDAAHTLLEAGVPLVAFLLMLAVGLDVTPADLRALAPRWRLLFSATAAQTVVLPTAALGLAGQFPSDSRMAEYLLLTAACRGGGMSNVYVYLARANTTLSATLTALSCILAPITMPLVIALYTATLVSGIPFALPLRTLLT